LSAGLSAIGVAPTTAIGAVMIYRLLTFWLPVIPGFFAFRFLQRRRYL
jgi:undecaprenyl-diphosphatase